MNKVSIACIAVILALVSISCRQITTFSVELPASELDIPFSINLDSLTSVPASSLSLWETTQGKVPIPFQVSETNPRRLHWIIRLQDGLTKRTYRLSKAAPEKFDSIKAVKRNGALVIRAGNKDLLGYQYETVYPPAGQDSSYKRSGFIHPLWAPNGQVLTRIQPPDHYHHYGIWNPWTRTLFEQDTVDFWNIRGRKGAVRFSKFVSQADGPVFAEYTALHEHVVFKKDNTEKIALNELQTVRVYHPGAGNNYYFVDITSKLSCASESPLLIIAYRYGGLGWRATEHWNRYNSEMLTSEGNTRDNTDNTRAKWIMVYGELPENDEGGMVILSHTSNYNHPEPLRVWDKNGNDGRGDMFINFAPTKNKDWLLEPGNTYTLRYRLVVFNGKMTKENAESAWSSFTSVSRNGF
ncbi:MAG: PmoA family protein [Cyclobacteriaceae bacterium]|nr:PmoA family protein [Cyclobacteriaceae bacterium]